MRANALRVDSARTRAHDIFNRNGLQDAVVNDRKAQISKLRVTRDFGTWVEADLG
jgi:hypothetical protein